MLKTGKRMCLLINSNTKYLMHSIGCGAEQYECCSFTRHFICNSDTLSSKSFLSLGREM